MLEIWQNKKKKRKEKEGQVVQEEGVPVEGYQDQGEQDQTKKSSNFSNVAGIASKLKQKGTEAKENKVKGLEDLSTMQKQEVKGQIFDTILELQMQENQKLKTNLESLKGTIEKLEATTDARLASAQRILESTKEISAPFNIDKLTESQEALVKKQLEELQSGKTSVADVMKIFNFNKPASPEETGSRDEE